MGKSTLVNSLFLTDLYKDRKLLNAEGESLYYLCAAVIMNPLLAEYLMQLHKAPPLIPHVC